MNAPDSLPLVKRLPFSGSPRSVLRVFNPQVPSFLLESALRHQVFGRYSIAGTDPFTVLKVTGQGVSIGGHDQLTGDDDPFAVIKKLLERYRVDAPGLGQIPAGAAVGYWGYELKRYVEKVPQQAVNDAGLPDACLGLYDAMVVFDHTDGSAVLISTGLPERESGRAMERARRRLAELEELVDKAGSIPDMALTDPVAAGPLRSNFIKRDYIHALQRIKEYIAAGDIYQANLSQRFTVPVGEDALTVYERLCRNNPAPFAAFLQGGDFQIVSASPERFLFMDGDMVETRPIKGTRPRGRDRAEDERLAAELLASPKDRAELLMIIDLERNDLGRVCSYGSVHVPDLFALESYATVHHLVSTVRGELRPGAGQVDCLKNAFPGGSITGAPKIRAIEIIDELEPNARAVYTGSIGYLGFNGISDLNIAIRTMAIKDGTAYFQAGGGIVADSDPEEEYHETLVKARALMRVLGVSEEDL